MKTTSCTEPKHYAFDNAPRCNARTKRNNSNPCRSPAVRGKKRCRMHGGSKGNGGQKDNGNAIKHGYTTKVAKQFRKAVKTTLNKAMNLKEELGFIVDRK